MSYKDYDLAHGRIVICVRALNACDTRRQYRATRAIAARVLRWDPRAECQRFRWLFELRDESEYGGRAGPMSSFFVRG